MGRGQLLITRNTHLYMPSWQHAALSVLSMKGPQKALDVQVTITLEVW